MPPQPDKPKRWQFDLKWLFFVMLVVAALAFAIRHATRPHFRNVDSWFRPTNGVGNWSPIGQRVFHVTESQRSAAVRLLKEQSAVPIGSLKSECLDRTIFFGERALRNAVQEYLAHTTPSGITKDSATRSLIRKIRWAPVKAKFTAENGLAGCSVTTTATRRSR